MSNFNSDSDSAGIIKHNSEFPGKPHFDLESTPDLPGEYGRTHIVLLMRDPLWGFTFWEITNEDLEAMRSRLGQDLWAQSRMVLRVYDLSGEKNHEAAPSFDISLPDDFRIASWYIRFPSTGRTYGVEIGRISDEGEFFAYVRSQTVTAPADDYSSRIDHTWEVIDREYEELLGGELERIRRTRTETIRTARDLNIEREREFRQKILRNYLEKALSSSSVVVPGVGIAYSDYTEEIMPGSSEVTMKPGASEVTMKPGASEIPLRPGASEIPLRPGASEVALRPGASDSAYASVLGVPIAGGIKPGASESAIKPGASEIPLRPGASEVVVKLGSSEILLKPGASEVAMKPGASETLLKPGASETLLKPGASEGSRLHADPVGVRPDSPVADSASCEESDLLAGASSLPVCMDFSGATVFGDDSAWASVSVEVILYGEAAPGSTVTIAGVVTTTGEDGRYSVRLALPSSVQELPIAVISPGGRKIEFTTTIERRDTRRNG